MMKPKKSTPRCIIIKMSKLKDKEKNLKSRKRKKSYIQGNLHKTII